jgi:hypothetical protein
MQATHKIHATLPNMSRNSSTISNGSSPTNATVPTPLPSIDYPGLYVADIDWSSPNFDHPLLQAPRPFPSSSASLWQELEEATYLQLGLGFENQHSPNTISDPSQSTVQTPLELPPLVEAEDEIFQFMDFSLGIPKALAAKLGSRAMLLRETTSHMPCTVVDQNFLACRQASQAITPLVITSALQGE